MSMSMSTDVHVYEFIIHPQKSKQHLQPLLVNLFNATLAIKYMRM